MSGDATLVCLASRLLSAAWGYKRWASPWLWDFLLLHTDIADLGNTLEKGSSIILIRVTSLKVSDIIYMRTPSEKVYIFYIPVAFFLLFLSGVLMIADR